MGWQESYNVLVELFPQVDVRLIKGAALEHGNDVGEAADFILNEILGADTPEVQQPKEQSLAGSGLSPSSQETELRAVAPSDSEVEGGCEASQATLVGRSQCDFEVTEVSAGTLKISMGDDARGLYSASFMAGSVSSRDAADSASRDSLKQMVDELRPDGTFGETEPSSHTEANDEVFAASGREEDREVDTPENEDRVAHPSLDHEEENTALSKHSSAATDWFFGISEDAGLQEELCEDENENELWRAYHAEIQEIVAPESVLDDFVSREAVPTDTRFGSDGEVSHQLAVTPAIDHEEFLSANSGIVTTDGARLAEAREEEHLGDTLNSHSTDEPEGAGILDATESMQKSYMSGNSMDAADWESIHSNSIHLTRMETIDDLVEEAKIEKEDLITSIEDIRALRLKTDQAESVARQAKDDAARGGLDVFAKVEEMRQLLSRAREANAVHEGEVYGEKAVLATEARELRRRLVQVKAEKSKALSALNEIKEALQARLEAANREREAAELDKVTKEALARDALAKEESLLAQVAQQSRDLDAEADACTELREFLMDRGSVVDALQGEVAVLWEDAETLKKDLDRMSLSCSAGYVHMLSRTSSEMLSSLGSRSGKFGNPYAAIGQLSDHLAHSGNGAVSAHSATDAIIPPFGSDKRTGSSIPSLITALSGSQLTNSSNSVHSSLASNDSVVQSSGSRNALIVDPAAQESQLLGATENVQGPIGDVKYPSSSSSATSPGDAVMALFPGEDMEPEYSAGGQNNLIDIFRSEKPLEAEAGTDDDDWDMLDPVALLSKRSSESSSTSSSSK